MEDRTGTSVIVNTKAPSKAKPNVKAKGENIFPSTFWKAKMGNNAVIIINLEKKTDFALLRAVTRINPGFESLLKESMPISPALASNIT